MLDRAGRDGRYEADLVDRDGEPTFSKCRAISDEIIAHPALGGMDFAMAESSLKLFAREVLPVVHKMAGQIHPSAMPKVV
ncbi:MAG: hypothetical protein EOP61_37580 [Sphingomonadales bacterium]|nr:MAG: hypothetical protein EOP61_37580 [Sphingomonadales bacterium]